jgi:tRNA-dihydrouridine synthase
MKKHFGAYAAGFDGAKELRAELMETDNFAEVAAVIERRYPHLISGASRSSPSRRAH